MSPHYAEHPPIPYGSYGRKPWTPDKRDYAFRASRPYDGEFVDLSSHFPQPPYDQGSLGSCVANGTVAAVDFARVKQGLTPLGPPSRLFVYYQGRVRAGYPVDEDTGLQIRDGFAVIGKDGAPPESDWSYDVQRFADRPTDMSFIDARLDEAIAFGAVEPGDIDATIASGYPVVFGFDVFESFESDTVARTGVMTIPARGETNVGGHCVVAVSTPKDGADLPGGVPGMKYRRCRNSWSSRWGDGGYFWMPVPVMESSASDFWAVTTMSDPAKPAPVRPGPEPDPGSLIELENAAVAWLRHPTSRRAIVALATALRAWLARQ